MPAAKLSPSAWNEVKQASEAGVSDAKLVETYPITAAAIRKRRSREQWQTPANAEQAVQLAKVKGQHKVTNNATVTSVTSAPQTVAQTLVANAETGSVKASELILALLSKADPARLAALQDVRDVATAGVTLRTLAGLDKPQVNVAVGASFFGDESSAWGQGAIVEAD